MSMNDMLGEAMESIKELVGYKHLDSGNEAVGRMDCILDVEMPTFDITVEYDSGDKTSICGDKLVIKGGFLHLKKADKFGHAGDRRDDGLPSVDIEFKGHKMVNLNKIRIVSYESIRDSPFEAPVTINVRGDLEALEDDRRVTVGEVEEDEPIYDYEVVNPETV